MLTGAETASPVVGFPANHIRAIQAVADRLQTMISFRGAGEAALGLISESYGMKGFRIDTKSCDWGPMCGFVCMDQRLSKATTNKAGAVASFATRNEEWTREALQGHINHRFFGMQANAAGAIEQAREIAELRNNWTAAVMPIAISEARRVWLEGHGYINGTAAEDGSFTGVAVKRFGDQGPVTLVWRLVPLTPPFPPWAPTESLRGSDRYYAVCVDADVVHGFKKAAGWQRYAGGVGFAGVRPMTYKNKELILGLCNPGTAERGFKAVVTADYDLFSIGPRRATINPAQDLRAMSKAAPANQLQWAPTWIKGARGQWVASHAWTPASKIATDLAIAVKSKEHYDQGNVSARIQEIAAAVNTALLTEGGYHGGTAVHHNDEAGNMGLPKGGLLECMPILLCMPRDAAARSMAQVAGNPAALQGTFCLQSLDDFRQFVFACRAQRLRPNLKSAWLIQAGVGAG